MNVIRNNISFFKTNFCTFDVEQVVQFWGGQGENVHFDRNYTRGQFNKHM